ncbi:diaminopimelate epimerase [Halovivax asiaticus JCM 14624]|uniref:Diaminopimelate epimerase n=1 Tax=Halovivax asiaticus JCM 14624 TaxID=1227490 RepID=M0BMV0_9EURY|nr:diaminopimelate epimerase [Halovivax asiaticus]ELZ12221.1 diaminopimelate epimerase [Halovivax asiaticus JCM 14624]
MSTIAVDRETIAASRYHGTGNDFLLVDADEPVPKRRSFARRVCDPDEGFGVDGVLFLALEPEFAPPRVVMTLVQPDGSVAPMCGNGARCAAAWAMERTGADAVMIDTQAGTRPAERVSADADGPAQIAVEMNRPAFDPASVPVSADAPVVDRPVSDVVDLDADSRVRSLDGDGPLRITAVDTGVPHVVAFVEDVDSVELDRFGPAIRHAEAFPRGTNVTLASPTSTLAAGSSDSCVFDQRTYERGVEGETAACGTGAVAIAAVASRLAYAPRSGEWELHPPGGTLRVRFDAHHRAVLEGPVVHETDHELPVSECECR